MALVIIQAVSPLVVTPVTDTAVEKAIARLALQAEGQRRTASQIRRIISPAPAAIPTPEGQKPITRQTLDKTGQSSEKTLRKRMIGMAIPVLLEV